MCLFVQNRNYSIINKLVTNLNDLLLMALVVFLSKKVNWMLKNGDDFSRACVILLLDGKACHRLWCDQIVRDAIARWVMHMYVLHFACASDIIGTLDIYARV